MIGRISGNLFERDTPDPLHQWWARRRQEQMDKYGERFGFKPKPAEPQGSDTSKENDE